MRKKSLVVLMATMFGLCAAARGQIVEPPFNLAYVATELGSPPAVPPQYGGLTLKYDDPNVLLIGGEANWITGAIYAVNLVRSGGHIVGYSGIASVHCTAAYNDGGVAYGPDNVLFLARWPVNQLGQSRPGTGMTNKTIDLAPFNVEVSLSALNFVPPGFPGAGQFKMVTYHLGQWLDVTISPDGHGTYDIDTVTDVVASRMSCGPEGFVYVPAGLPLFPNPAMLVAEYSCGTISAFDIDENGNPLPESRRVFLSGLSGAEGALIDPATGDFLFSTFGGFNRVVVVRGFSNECSTCRGDLNADNHVDGRDIRHFVTCFILATGEPAGVCRCADMDHDNDVDPDDVVLFVDELVNDPDSQCP